MTAHEKGLLVFAVLCGVAVLIGCVAGSVLTHLS